MTGRCTSDPIEDVGCGVRIERRYLDGSFDGIAWWHQCHGYDRVAARTL